MSTHVVADVKADLERRGVDLSGPCGAFQITRRVAWRLRADGAGLLSKPSGNNCEGFSVDIVVYPDGRHYDVLVDGGGKNEPTFHLITDPERVDPARWRAPIDPDDAPLPAPEPVPAPIPPPVDLGPVLDRLRALERTQTDLIKQLLDIAATLETLREAVHLLASRPAVTFPAYVGSLGLRIRLTPEGQ